MHPLLEICKVLWVNYSPRQLPAGICTRWFVNGCKGITSIKTTRCFYDWGFKVVSFSGASQKLIEPIVKSDDISQSDMNCSKSGRTQPNFDRWNVPKSSPRTMWWPTGDVDKNFEIGCLCAYIWVYIYITGIYISICLNMCIYESIYKCVYIHISIYKWTIYYILHVRVYIYIHIYIYIIRVTRHLENRNQWSKGVPHFRQPKVWMNLYIFPRRCQA